MILSSCTQYKKIVYLQEQEEQDTAYFISKPPLYFLKPGDILYIYLSSINQDVVNAFNINKNNTNSSAYFSDPSLYINGYSINDSGYIDVPIIGKVEVGGLTISEARNAIQKKVDEYLKDATAIVKLLSYNITVLGEVNRPGVYKNYNENITILEGLAMAGDINDYGNKRKVLVVRPNDKGSETYKLDLTDINVLNQEGFYLMPNDIVYVKPVKTKAFRLNSPNISIILSMITTTIIVINFITK
ncbi:MAG: polysaccharide biosynthesis/export family protein [Marinilabiliales bacterium]